MARGWRLGVAVVVAAAVVAPGCGAAICEQRLASARRAVALPNLTFVESPQALSSSVCGRKVTCCRLDAFVGVAGAFEAYDLWYDGVVQAASRFVSHADELFLLALRELSLRAFSINADFSLVWDVASENVNRLVASLDNQNVLVRTNAFVNAVVGYVSGLLCSICDPYQKLYLVEGEGEAAPLVLTMHDSLCWNMAGKFLELTRLVRDAVADSRNAREIEGLLRGLCTYAGDPLDPAGTFPRKGRAGCQKLAEDWTSFRAMVVNLNVSMATLVGCNSTQTCSALLCERVLQGLAYSWEPIRDALESELQVHCTVDLGCDRALLQDYVEYLLPRDAVLATEGRFTTDGVVVRTALTNLWNVSALDANAFGCGQYLSRYACSTLPDVTFTSTHIKAIIIACSIVFVVLALAVALLLKHFAVSCTKRSTLVRRQSSEEDDLTAPLAPPPLARAESAGSRGLRIDTLVD